MIGYSGKPLAKKLGIKESSRVKVENPPDNYFKLIQPLPSGVTISARLKSNIDIWHLFVKSKEHLHQQLKMAMKDIPSNGIIWVFWPKKASDVSTDMTEEEIRNAALPLGLVDVKVCAIDEIWPGLKLMLRKSNQK